ncbi:sirohydrochlorin cobaltochelatase [Desulfitispora alkaliphila]|uniref:sirohydrochlorin chelatase n=1 Tax=Desulfitispora alkaliphila TaxID=622674 RepID=UPI003D1E7BED
MTTAYVVLGHGSRAKEAKEDLEATVDLVRAKMDTEHVYTAYMELNEPSLEDVIADIAQKGNITKAIVVPFFLFRGIHLQRDIPGKIERLNQKHENQLKISFGKHLGVDQRIADIIVDRIHEVD